MSRDLASLDPETLRFIHADWQLWARDDQLPPRFADAGLDWRVWLILGGRGAGKTRAGAEWVRAKALGIPPLGAEPARRIALVGETQADVRRVMIEGVSGLLAIHGPGERPELEISKMQLVWPNGSVAQIFSAENPDSLRGPQFDAAWCDAFCGACLERSGIASTRSLAARSYASWGVPLAAPRIGAVAVFSRASNPAEGHVGFWLGETEDEVVLLGGNQSNAVTVAAIAKTRLLALRWPRDVEADAEAKIPAPAQPPVGAPAAKPADRKILIFDRALAHALDMEGGFTNDPHDPGGPTNLGITLGVFAAWRGVTIDAANRDGLIGGLKAIDPATVSAIYRKRYWDVAGCGALPDPLALMHFDTAVNHGAGTAIRVLQEAVGADIDGEIGHQTTAAISNAPLMQTLERYAAIRERRYRALPHFWRFGRGWLRRVATTLELCRQLARAGTPDASPQPEGDLDMTTTSTDTTKWWGHSITIWGTIVTLLSTVLPALAPVTGVDISGDIVQNAGDQVVGAFQSIGTLFGTLMTIYGRVRATQPIALFKPKA